MTYCCSAQFSYEVTPAYPHLTFQHPVDIQHPDDSTNLLYVVEQDGIIRAFEDRPDVDSSWVFLDIRELVSPKWGESGLLGLAFDPNFKENGYFYVYHTAEFFLRTTLVRYTVDPDNRRVALPDSRQILMTISQPDVSHNGGQLVFGKDGYLYMSVGDGGWSAVPSSNAQDSTNLLGKILRIDVHDTTNGKLYGIPSDNPFADYEDGILDEIYAYGLRNPWRFSIDDVTGTIWAGDVGQSDWEEIDKITPGKNYGWPIREGAHCNLAFGTDCDTTGLIDPIIDLSHDSVCCITGGYIYRGKAFQDLFSKYIYGDFGSGKIWALSESDSTNKIENTLLVDSDHMISSFGLDHNNELIIIAYQTGIEQNPGMLFHLEQHENPPTGEVSSNVMASEFRFELISPTPSIHQSTFSMTLQSPQQVSLAIYNLRGRCVSIPVHEQSYEAGRHTIDVNIEELPIGTYYAVLQCGTLQQTVRIEVAR